MAGKKWSNLSTGQKRGIALSGAVQIGLLIAALIDIHRRPAEQVRGSKWVWTAVSFINFAGPISYFAFGCKRGR
jgi:Phospholipase_D-nuclease N-terminal